jgi:hypothetical protein
MNKKYIVLSGNGKLKEFLTAPTKLSPGESLIFVGSFVTNVHRPDEEYCDQPRVICRIMTEVLDRDLYLHILRISGHDLHLIKNLAEKYSTILTKVKPSLEKKNNREKKWWSRIFQTGKSQTQE